MIISLLLLLPDYWHALSHSQGEFLFAVRFQQTTQYTGENIYKSATTKTQAWCRRNIDIGSSGKE